VGNVWEWTELDPDDRPPSAPESVWVLGGSFRHPCVKDQHIARTSVSDSGGRYDCLGFRCVLDPEE
jgi:formylglycine-generating enzyme required for sulfatase activity